jgi:MoaA/NifB/PqqE/SkfB family radical SAM enzyme
MDQYQLIARWLQGTYKGKILPWQVDIDTTNICNQACYYCNSELFRTHNPVYQSAESYIKLIDDLSSWSSFDPETFGSVSNVIFSGGGEPTLLPGYENIVEHSIDQGFAVAINTNGTKLSKLLSLPRDKLSRMAYIGLDIDSANPATYEKIRTSKTHSDRASCLRSSD